MPHLVVSTVTDVIRRIDGVRAVAVLDQDIDAGQVTQQSIDWRAQDRSRNIWSVGSYTHERLRQVDPARPAWSTRCLSGTIQDTVRVFGFDDQYRRHYPSVRLVSGSLRNAAAALVAGVVVGTLLGLPARALQPLFVLDRSAVLSALGAAALVALVLIAALASALTTTELLRRLRPTELLREM